MALHTTGAGADPPPPVFRGGRYDIISGDDDGDAGSGRRDAASLVTMMRDFGMQDLSSLATTTRGLPTARFVTDWYTEATARIEAD